MKNLLIIAYYYSPQNNGGVQRIVNFKRYLPKYGYNVYILTTNAEGVCADDENVFRINDKGYEYSHKTNLIFNYLFRIVRKTCVYFGIVGDWYYWWKKEVIRGFENLAKDINFDYIMCSYPPIIDLEIGEYLSEKYDIPLIVDYRDGLMYEPLSYITSKSHNFLRRTIELEERVSRKACLITTVTEKIADYYEQKYGANVSIIENGFDEQEEFPSSCTKKLADGFNVVYTGSLAKSREVYQIDVLCNVLQCVEDVNGDYKESEIIALTKIKTLLYGRK